MDESSSWQGNPYWQDRAYGSPDDALLALSALLSAPAMEPVILTYDHIASMDHPKTHLLL
jgi:hypothetical protein